MEEPSGERVCVAALLDHHGVDSDGIHVCGESMLDLYEALSDAGLDVRGYEGTLSGLRTLEAPGILHWEDEEDGKGRFVVCYGFRSGKYVIGDPKRGVRRVGPPDLARHWMSRMLLYANSMAQRASVRVDVERYRCFDVEAVGLGNDRVLVRSRRTGTARVLRAVEAQQLFRADRFRSIAAHESRIRRDYAGGVAGAADSGTWRGWIDDGMLTSETAVREEMAHYGADSAAFPDERDGISAIGIPTRNRVGSVLAALRSYHTNASMHGRRVRFVVADSSSAPDQERLASALDVLRKDIDIEVEHLDEAWRANLIRTLADETDCSPDVLRFALYGCETCGTNYGANRNALLLATAGELSVHVDDDTSSSSVRGAGYPIRHSLFLASRSQRVLVRRLRLGAGREGGLCRNARNAPWASGCVSAGGIYPGRYCRRRLAAAAAAASAGCPDWAYLRRPHGRCRYIVERIEAISGRGFSWQAGPVRICGRHAYA